jgi:hypothetical protein
VALLVAPAMTQARPLIMNTPSDVSPARAWVQRTCAQQGLAPQVTDPGTVAAVATLLGAPLDPPHGIEAPLVEAVQSAHGRPDGDVGQDGGNDGVLPRQRQGRPGGAQRSRSLHEVVKG